MVGAQSLVIACAVTGQPDNEGAISNGRQYWWELERTIS
jgi:hypothetical protein